ncbi:MAG: hypothetical protein CEE38_07890 [Planctomycetes bacterium B3_Pla]|nr:MAG: hypothetical protein CEE38_07890 [Planctomycetes bacterium B3_Pla]
MKQLTLPTFGFEFHETANTIAADTEAAVFIPEIWAQRVLGRLHARCPMVGAVLHDYKDEIAKEGDTVNVQKRGNLTTNDKTPNTTVTLQNPTATTIPVALDNHKEVSFLVEDVAEAQANVDIIDGYTRDGADAIVEDIEALLTAHYADAPAANVITWDSEDVLGTIMSARTKIVVDNKCPDAVKRYLIIKDMADLVGTTAFTSKEFLDQSFVETGTVGMIAGFNTKESGKIVTTTSPTAVHRIALAKEAIALVTRKLPDPPAGVGVKGGTVEQDGIGVRVLIGYSMDYLGLQATIDMLFGSGVLRAEWICDIK